MPVLATATMTASCGSAVACFRVSGDGFPPFLPKTVERIKDPSARELAKRIQRLPVKFLGSSIMSSCVKPTQQNATEPVVLLHGFDSSCLEWRYVYPYLEHGGLETWAVDILGWGFSDLKMLPSTSVAAKREHLYELWRTHIGRPMVLVGPSLGASVAIDFSVIHPEVTRLVLIDASVYADGTGNLSKLSRIVAYAGVSLLKSVPLRLYANILAFNNVSLSRSLDWTNIGRLHCLLPWWEDATIDFMFSGGYNVRQQIKQVKQKTLILWGENDRITNTELGLRLHAELPNSDFHQIPDCGHLPHVEKPDIVAEFILKFVGVEKPASSAVEEIVPRS
ncbi:uncharacterized protein LOC110019550 isoform X2 [Phalaenopsis equestris]|uniref:uncharacterized protein LOC110019550 isoform X2 n=1 Tax=Phalaenopsis equestris TaxID=78828 RepID=UPI0009E2ABD2|nr:uncharacterized protein LOC110019550 isoform X2 [Phalaenopsis equestris]